VANSPKVQAAIRAVFKELMAMSKEEFDAELEKHRRKTFMELLISGNAKPEEVDDHINDWHNSMGMVWFMPIALPEYLGMSDAEYKDFVECKRTVSQIAEDRNGK
jgi:hypothetical protein